MFAAIDETLARLYPTRCWGDRDDTSAFRATTSLGPLAAERLAPKLDALTLFRPGRPEETCDYVYVLCFGRPPSIIQIREGIVPPEKTDLEELYLRVALSTLAPFAAVQQVAMTLKSSGDDLIICEAPRTGVFDPILLPRMKKLVAVLSELDLLHLDFGDLTQPPQGFDPGDYGARFGGEPTVANYLFFPQPAAAVSTTVTGFPSR